jgi:putative redox protein
MNKDYLEINLHTINDKVKFVSNSRNNPEISIDYFPPIGNGEGYTSLELLLISISSCISTTILTLLREKMHKNVATLKTNTKGVVRDEHPRALTHIQVEMIFESQDVEEADIKAALAVSEEKLCPVWAMLKGNVEISVSYVINK